MNNRIAMFLLGATLALGFTLAAYLLSNALRTIKDDTGIRVKGFAEITVKSDMANWKLSAQVRSKDLKMGYESVENDIKVIQGKLKDYGFNESEYSIFAAIVEEEFKVNDKGNKTNDIENYKITQSITVISQKTELVDKASKSITEVMAMGVRVISYRPEYTYGKLEDLKIELIGKASGNALDRARAIAEKAGSHIGSIKSASQGVFQIVPVGSTETSDYGSYDTTTIDKVVKAVVTIDFAVTK
jgi:uncharacterized protein